MAVKDSENSKIPWLIMNPKQGADMYGDQVAMQPTQQDITNMSAQSMQAPVYAAPRNDQLSGFKTYMDDPETQALISELDANRKAAYEQAQQGVGQYEQLLQQHLDRTQNDPKLDLSPLMSFADNLYGTRLTQNYKSPTTSRGALETTAALQQGLQKAKGALTDDEQSYLSSRLGLLQKGDETKLNAIKALTGLEEAKAKAGENDKFKNNKEEVRNRENFHKEFGKPIEAMGDFMSHARDVKSLLLKNGKVPDVDSPDYQRYKSAVDNMIVRYNSDVAKLGALAGADLTLLSGATGSNPEFLKTWFNEKLQGGVKGTVDVLDSLETLVDRKVEDIGGTAKDIYGDLTDKQYQNAREKYFKKKSGNFSAGENKDPNKPLTREEKIKLLQSRGVQ